jgi:hypothetical protein
MSANPLEPIENISLNRQTSLTIVSQTTPNLTENDFTFLDVIRISLQRHTVIHHSFYLSE